MKVHNDFFKHGIFAVKSPAGEVLLDTVGTTAYAARAEFVRKHNKRWSVAEELGFSLAEFTESAQVRELPPEAVFDLPSTAYEWQLYSGAASDKVALELSNELRKQLTAARLEKRCTLEEAQRIRDHMYDVMARNPLQGATDSEPELVLVRAIERVLELPGGTLGR